MIVMLGLQAEGAAVETVPPSVLACTLFTGEFQATAPV